MTKTETEIKWFENDGTYAVTDRSGAVIESHIPTSDLAAERQAFHNERIASLRAWDDTHRG